MNRGESDRAEGDGLAAHRGAPPAAGGDGGKPPPTGSELRDAVLDMEEPLADLRSVLAALDLIASGDLGIERGDMVGLRYLAKRGRELAEVAHGHWRKALHHVDD